jgi:hypothetical protein
VTRTYVVGGRSYARVYRAYTFNGIVYHRFVPAIYFGPAFYGWAYNPWLAPVVFSWGFETAPWYGFYGAYFVPAPVYAAPALWLTDFLLAENIKAAYEAQQAAAAPPPAPGSQAAISPEIKELIADEVQKQLAEERSEAATASSSEPDADPVAESTPAALDPNQRVFVVSMNLKVPALSGGTCALTPGDILLRSTDSPNEEGNLSVNVLTSKPGDCAANSTAAIDLATLEEMHNDFRQQIDSGLAVLAQNQGKGGLPNGPAPAPRLAPGGQAAPDLDAASALLSQQQAATNNQ